MAFSHKLKLVPRLASQMSRRGKDVNKYHENFIEKPRLSIDRVKVFAERIDDLRIADYKKTFLMQWGYPCFEPGTLRGLAMYVPVLSKKTSSVDFMARLQKQYDISIPSFKRWLRQKRQAVLEHDQRFIPERHIVLGPDLAAAHFILLRGGAVRFAGEEKWIRGYPNQLPNKNDTSYKLEAIDASGMELVYEGYDNLVDLKYLKWLSLRNSPHVDDWHIDRMTQFSTTLEHLDIGGCPKVTERGISALHRLPRLKRLVVDNLPRFHFKELTCLLLEETFHRHIPHISGVQYLSPPEPSLPLPPTSDPIKLVLPP